ncbi:hypothetical protein FD723_40630 (plasmid) [Nostoc sp. C052]|uniref:hypothetical protein n=1 Tax=Nostoc sp. C052 TaxID=2576902 RepID=UPI0015C33F96|nr:hypothetical protein [Nostoc sp. C052]QLE46521.1 hypothetical protein FD723_40630 [Nostoc sp. C052]
MARCTINDATYQELQTFVEEFAPVSPQQINFWVNLICKVGLAALKNNKADFSKIIAGRNPEEWFYENNVTLLPVPTKAAVATNPEQLAPKVPALEEGKRPRKPKYNPAEYENILKSLDA